MSSTSSSKQTASKRSATEILASRYRHLFVLPSTAFLLVYLAVTAYIFTVISRGAFAFVNFIFSFTVAVLAASALVSALKIADKKTIATFRRTVAVLIAGEALWLVCTAFGAAYAALAGSTAPLTGAIVFGAFITTGFEFLVINGTFTERAGLSAALAVIHPTSTLVILRFQELAGGVDPVAVFSGVAAMAVVGMFTALLKRNKTTRGYDALTLFRSFMKTWVSAEPGDLEAIIAAHSEASTTSTKIMRFSNGLSSYFILLPGVHPGPFHPIGSYDLPGVVSRAFSTLGPAMTLHMPGGHEKNLATNAETLRYAEELKDYAANVQTHGDDAKVRGPIALQVGRANVSGTAFSDDLVVTVSFAPYGSDDLNPDLEAKVKALSEGSGLNTSVVDAHNSIEDAPESPDLGDQGWKQMIERVKQEEGKAFSVAYCHSKDFGFKGGADLTENGIALFMVESEGRKSVLVLADANNAVPGLRAEVLKALGTSGYELIEFCTSDSHNLAARGLTVERGYEALGEVTPVASIAKLVSEMAKLADTRLQPASYGSGQVSSKVRVFGAASLEEFARITQSSSKFARAYLRFAIGSTAALLALAILF